MTKEQLLHLLETNDKAVARALVVLYERQTSDEQHSEVTRNDNGRGFTPADAQMGSSMAKQYLSRGFLSPKQLAFWRKRNPKGRMKIGKYTRQILEQIQLNQKQKEA